MEELAYAAGKIVKGIGGLIYAFGEALVGFGPAEGKPRREAERRDRPEDEEN